MNDGRKWVLGFACLTLLLGGSALGQALPTDFNRLCLHNGGDYYYGGSSDFSPNMGTGKYYPSYTHIASTPTAGFYKWKIKGWSWVSMKGPAGTSVWDWTSMLQGVESNDYNYTAVPSVSMSCTFPAPHAFISGALVPNGSLSKPVFQIGPGGLPTTLPFVAGKDFLFPSSSVFSQDVNLFAVHHGTIDMGMIMPYYGYNFAVTLASQALNVASTTSIYQWVYEDQSPGDCHYLIVSGNEMDHHAGYPYSVSDKPGYYGKPHMLIWRPPYQVGWPTGIPFEGSSYALEMCLFVEDSVLVPVNVSDHAAHNPGNPFAAFGFDMGTACMTPLVSDGNATLGFATEDYKASGQAYAVLASRHATGSEYIGALSYDGNTHRYPCGGIDGVSRFFLARLSKWLHTVAYPFPACAYGNSTVGGHSAQLPIGTKFQASLPGKEYVFCGFPTNAVSNDCTAGWMVCWR